MTKESRAGLMWALSGVAWIILAVLMLSACATGSPFPRRWTPPIIPPVVQPPAHTTLPRLVPSGSFFRLETGEKHTVISLTDFQLFDIYLKQGASAVTALLDDRASIESCGINQLRVFGMAENLFHLDPREHADYYDKLPKFAQLLADHRCHFRFSFVAFADALLLMRDDLAAQQEHWRRTVDALRPVTNVLLELVNENDAGNPAQGQVNRIDTNAFENPAGICASHGSNGGEARPVEPVWCWSSLHQNDAYQWPRKVGHNPWEIGQEVGVPFIADENTRIPDRFNSEAMAFDAGAGGALLPAGSTIHCDGCRWSRFLTDDEKRVISAWVRGAKSVPLSCQDGPYTHRMDLEQPNAAETGERIYQRGDDAACIVRIRGAY